jgi:GAF domain-containing protein
MTATARPIFDAIVTAAVDVTAATVGWLLMIDDDELVVVAAAGGASPQSRVGRRVPVAGTAGLVISSEQPAAIETPENETSNMGAGGLDGNPAGVLAAPCGDEEVLGVLEVARPEGTETFTFDDVEEVTLLARVAGAALEELEEAMAAVPSPVELGAELERLAATDAVRYAALARMIDPVLGQN